MQSIHIYVLSPKAPVTRACLNARDKQQAAASKEGSQHQFNHKNLRKLCFLRTLLQQKNLPSPWDERHCLRGTTQITDRLSVTCMGYNGPSRLPYFKSFRLLLPEDFQSVSLRSSHLPSLSVRYTVLTRSGHCFCIYFP